MNANLLIEQLNNQYLIEGIDIDYLKKEILFNPNHEENIDTSLLNPTYTKIQNMEVISLFKRKENIDKTDGNPLVYALKGIKGWNIDYDNIMLLFKQFLKISKNIKSSYDTIVTVPSTNTLNTNLLYRLNKIIKGKPILDMFHRLSVSDVLECGINKDSDPKDFKKVYDILRKQNLTNSTFTYKDIPKNLRYVIKSSCSVTNELTYQEDINEKDILILDDTISSGKSISDTVQAINKNFNPKSITVITLFSGLN